MSTQLNTRFEMFVVAPEVEDEMVRMLQECNEAAQSCTRQAIDYGEHVTTLMDALHGANQARHDCQDAANRMENALAMLEENLHIAADLLGVNLGDEPVESKPFFAISLW